MDGIDLGRGRKAFPGVLQQLITGRYPMHQLCERAGGGQGIKDVIAVGEAV